VWGIFPYATQTEWWREWVEGHDVEHGGWSGHAAMEAWRLDHRVQFEPTEATKTRIREEFERGERDTAKATGAGHNVAIVIWKPNPGFVAPWAPTVRYWSYR
jgi:hypothetical protein